MQVVAGFAQLVAAALEAFFYSNANAFNSSAGLTYNIDKSFQRAAVSQEVINNQHMVCFGQESFGNNNVVCFAMGIGINLSEVNILIHIAAAGFLGKHYRNAKIHCRNAGNTDTGGFNSQDFSNIPVCKQAL